LGHEGSEYGSFQIGSSVFQDIGGNLIDNLMRSEDRFNNFFGA
jgi:hypothetical protein